MLRAVSKVNRPARLNSRFVGALLLALAWQVPAAAEEDPLYERDIHPIFVVHCTSCHFGETAAAGLDLLTHEGLLEGSVNGPVVESGSPELSPLFNKITRREMPPPGLGPSLSEGQLRTIRIWIEAGLPTDESERLRSEAQRAGTRDMTAEDREFWSFRPLERLEPPKVKNHSRVRTPIDAFLLAKLEEKGLSFSPDAPERTLMRRAYFDLIGLPPSPEESAEYLADDKPGAYERMIDRLLRSAHYGERWGRHWLDVAGFVQEFGFGADIEHLPLHKGIWRYRDYVIKSFNQDKPYDLFIAEQLAGDELVDWRKAEDYTPEILDSLTATGYLRMQRDSTYAGETNNARHRLDIIFRLVDHVTSGILGLTVGCARCHDHKYDPIPQRDYYRLAAIFATSYNPEDWLLPDDRVLPDVPAALRAEIEAHNAEVERPLEELTKQLEDLRQPYRRKLFESKMAAAGVPELWRQEVTKAFDTEASRRTAVQRYFVTSLSTALRVTNDAVDTLLSDREKASNDKLQQRIETLKSWKRSYGKIPALWDNGEPPESYLYYRGNTDTPGPELTPGFLTVLSDEGQASARRPPDTKGGSSGRRLALARWLTGPASSLTARVLVNRVWMHHFGKGIVETVENFGALGTRPVHSELLDWLADDFVENGWKTKRLHRLIMTSTAYRQMSRRAAESEDSPSNRADPSNALLWRGSLRRLDAEALRDSILAVSGRLNRTVGGPHAMLTWGPEGLITVLENSGDNSGEFRRSVYLFTRKSYSLSFLDVFDLPLIEINALRRSPSATPLQSLTMLNGEFVMKAAADFAERVEQHVGGEGSDRDRTEAAFQIAFARPPTAAEVQASVSHMDRQTRQYIDLGTSAEQAAHSALASLCQMLMASNEFLYLE